MILHKSAYALQLSRVNSTGFVSKNKWQTDLWALSCLSFISKEMQLQLNFNIQQPCFFTTHQKLNLSLTLSYSSSSQDKKSVNLQLIKINFTLFCNRPMQLLEDEQGSFLNQQIHTSFQTLMKKILALLAPQKIH